jgi:uncharacterized protein DUF1566
MPVIYRLLLVFLLVLFLSENGHSEDSRPDAALNTVSGSIGISEVESQMLLREVRSKLDDHYRLISERMFDQAYEKWEEQIQSEEQCTSDRCIRFIQDTLQIDRLFSFSVMRADNFTQLSLVLSRLEDTISETENCNNCDLAKLMERVGVLIAVIVEKDLGIKPKSPKPIDPEPPSQVQVPKTEPNLKEAKGAYEGVVIDDTSGLMWEKSVSDIYIHYESAFRYCEKLNLASYDDWRIPNIRELKSLFRIKNRYPTNKIAYWSTSTSTPTSTSIKLCLDFETGNVFECGLGTKMYLRCVRTDE